MKKLIALLLVLVLSVCLFAACGKQPEQTEQPAPTDPVASEDQPTPTEDGGDTPDVKDLKVALVTVTQSFDFFINAEKGMQDVFNEQGIEFAVYNYDIDSDRMIEVLTQVQAMDFDVVICSFYDNSCANTQLQELRDRGIKVITYESAPSDDSVADAIILSDDFTSGYLCGKAMCEAIGGEGQVFSYCNRTMNSVANRLAGFEKALTEYPNVEHVTNLEDSSSESDTNAGAALIQNVISLYPDIKGYFSGGESNCLLAAPVVQDLGITDQIYIATVDCTSMLLDYMQQGIVNCCIDQDSYNLGRTVAETAIAAYLGETVEHYIYSPVTLVDSSNMADFIK